jgi:hypothetical protein
MKRILCIAALLVGSAQAQVTCQNIGSTTFCSDGRTFQHIGNSTFGSDGSSSQRIGNSTFINPAPQPIYTPPPVYVQPPPMQPLYPTQPSCYLNMYGQRVCR